MGVWGGYLSSKGRNSLGVRNTGDPSRLDIKESTFKECSPFWRSATRAI